MVESARAHDRIVQVGTQNRSASYLYEALNYVREGELGDIPLVKVYNMKSGGPKNPGDPGTKPDGFDRHTWLGPAPVPAEFHPPILELIFQNGQPMTFLSASCHYTLQNNW